MDSRKTEKLIGAALISGLFGTIAGGVLMFAGLQFLAGAEDRKDKAERDRRRKEHKARMRNARPKLKVADVLAFQKPSNA